MATCNDRDDEFTSALVLHIIYPDEEYSDWKPLFYFYSAMLCDDVLIENIKYGYITIQNNGAMKIYLHVCANGWNQAFFPLVCERRVRGHAQRYAWVLGHFVLY